MSLVKYSKISDYKIKKVLLYFCADVDATKTSYLLGKHFEFGHNSIFRQIYIYNQFDISKYFTCERLIFSKK